MKTKILIATAVALLGLKTSDAEAKWYVESTSYCLHGQMSDGTTTRERSVANNFLPLGTKVTIYPGFLGRHWFIVRDHIGYGTQLDFWQDSCSGALAYGRRMQTIFKGWFHHHSKRYHKHHHHRGKQVPHALR